MAQNQICQNEKDGDITAQKKEMKLADEEDFGNDFFGKWRSWLWNTMEYPWTSKTARYISVLYGKFMCFVYCVFQVLRIFLFDNGADFHIHIHNIHN